MLAQTFSKLRRSARLGFSLLLLAAVSAGAAEKRVAVGYVATPAVQTKLAPLGRVPGTNQIRLAIGLPLRDREGLTNLLAALYDPTSPEFHRYLTPAEFTARFGPTPADYAAVLNFAKTNGLTVSATHPNRLLVDVTGSVAGVERALHLRLNSFQHPREARTFFAPDTAPTVAAGLPVFAISGLDDYARPHPNSHLQPNLLRANASPRGGSSPQGSYMGNDFRQAYVPGTSLTGAGQSVGLLQFDGFYLADITNYANAIGLTSNVPQIVVVPVDGGVTTPGGGGIEVSLDIEMVLSMAPGLSTVYVYEAPNPSPWVDLLSRMANDNLSRQLSSSWGGGGADPASEQIFLQMAAQGQSFFNASGDSDAFVGAVDFPADSPNITQVGGTTLTTDSSGNYTSETVWNWGYVASQGAYLGSSGGISPAVEIPLWQLGLDMTTNHGSTLQRNIPDVALAGDEIYVRYNNGQATTVGGTSCAAPLWAGLTALINEQAAQLGQPAVGFLNPALYAIARGPNYAAAFHDVVVGNNTSSTSPANFYAAPGYDLCTGLGTPNGTNLINLLAVADDLRILPAEIIGVSGPVGGPFTATNWTLTLRNYGTGSMAWASGGAPDWLAVSPPSGTLSANGWGTLGLNLSGAEALPAGSYLAAVMVTNLISLRVQPVGVRLNIGQSLVQNGGFETGDFTSWTLVGDTSDLTYVYNAVATEFAFPGVVHSGSYGAFLGQGGYLATLSQTLETVPGQRYLVSCWLHNPAAGSIQAFGVSWNGTTCFTFTNPPAFAWTNLQFVATATAASSVLQFAAENDPNYFGLDDVSVQRVPDVAFASFAIRTNQFQFRWNSLAGLNYQIQYQTNLTEANWLNLGNITAVTNSATFVDAPDPATVGQRFYRLVLLLP